LFGVNVNLALPYNQLLILFNLLM